jgi:Domain of unknown function (DUF4340)
MRRRQFYILVGAALALAIVGTVYEMVQSASWEKSAGDRRVLSDVPIQDVTEIDVQASKDKLTLKNQDNAWRVLERDGYPADFSKVRDLVRTLWELKIVRDLQVGPSQFDRLEIKAPNSSDGAGIELSLKSPSKTLVDMILGKKIGGSGDDENSVSSGRFIFLPALKDRVYVVSELFSSVDPINVPQWLDKTFIKTDDLKSITRKPVGNASGWKLTRPDKKSPWQLADAASGETLNPDLATSLSSFAPAFEDVKTDGEANTGLQQPVEIELETFDGFDCQLAIGTVAPNSTHFLRVKVDAHLLTERKPEANETPDEKKKRDDEFSKQLEAQRKRLETEKGFEKWVYLVSDWSIEPLLKGHDDVVKKPSPSPSPSALVLPSPTLSASPSPSPGLIPQPSPSPSESPTASPSGSPSAPPSESPTVSPSESPSASPSESPAALPSASVSPTTSPESVNSPAPTESPAGKPAVSPTGELPTPTPVESPSATP